MGGGGGGSGKVGYAGYIEAAHELFIVGSYNADTFAYPLRTILATAMGNNPYTAQAAYDPSTALTAMDTAVSEFETFVATLTSETSLAAEATTFDAEVSNILETETIPKFDMLMRDIGAVQSSTNVIGKALIYAEKTRNVNTHLAKSRVEWKRLYVSAKQAVMDAKLTTAKTKIVAYHDEEQRDAEIEKLETNWQIDTLLKGGQFLGILGGGSMIPEGASKAQSAVSGGLAGAAAGVAAGSFFGPIGMVAGGLGGAALGAGAAFL